MAYVSRPLKVHYTISGTQFFVDENTPKHVYEKVAFESAWDFLLEEIINGAIEPKENEVYCEMNGRLYETSLTCDEYWETIKGE